MDRNDKNKAYYAIYDGTENGKIPLSKFEGYKKNYFLCDALGLKAEAAGENDVPFVVETDRTKATLRIGETYYRLAADGDTGEKFKIMVNLTGDRLLEEYYLTIQTQKGSTAFANITVECENAALGNKDKNGMIPTVFDSNCKFTRNDSEYRILFGDFFQQTVTVTAVTTGTTGTTDTTGVISDANNTIHADLKVQIDYTNPTWRKNLAPYAGGIRLYQRFELQAKDTKDGITTPIDFTNRTASIRYLNGTTQVGSTTVAALGAEGVMVLDFPEGVAVNTTSENAATLTAQVDLTYTHAQMQAQFHTRSNTEDGLQLWANSHLALSQAALKGSNNPTRGEASQHFYLKESVPVSLVYNASGTTEDVRVNQLGINGRVENTAAINSIATYNVSALEAARAASQLSYSMELYCKDDSGEFQPVENKNLLTVGSATATLVHQDGTQATVTPGETFTGGIDISVPIQISLPLTVASGEGFTGTYANYMVKLTVYLDVSGSSATDYIIYTNAKIKFPLVTSD